MKRKSIVLMCSAGLAVVMGLASVWPESGRLPLGLLIGHSLFLFFSFSFFMAVLPKHFKLPMQIFIAMVLGILAGWLLQHMGSAALVTDYLGIFGVLFLQLLKMVIVPLVFASLVCGVAAISDVGKLGSLGLKTLTYYVATTGIAVLIGLLVINMIQPGVKEQERAVALQESVLTEENSADEEEPPVEVRSVGQRIQQEFLPKYVKNPIMADQQILTILIFALVLGAAFAVNKEKSEGALKFFQGIDAAMVTIVLWIMLLAPLGVFALMAKAIATLGIDYILSLAKYCFTVLLGLGLHFSVLVFGILVFLGRMSPWRFLKGMAPAIELAFSTSSSSATLPVTIECAANRVGVDRKVCSFMLPLGATINMDGTALYLSCATIFVAQVYGIDLSLQQQFMVFLSAIIVSIGTAGIPGGSLALMTIVFTSAGVPAEGIGIVLGVDRFLDMCRTMVNVTGDSVGTVIVARSENAASTSNVNGIE